MTLAIAYWLPDRELYVDEAAGRWSCPARPEPRVTEVEREGRRLAAIIHDPALADERRARACRPARRWRSRSRTSG